MKRLLTVFLIVLWGPFGLALAEPQDIQAELDKGLAFARSGDYAAARIICPFNRIEDRFQPVRESWNSLHLPKRRGFSASARRP